MVLILALTSLLLLAASAEFAGAAWAGDRPLEPGTTIHQARAALKRLPLP